MIQYIVLLIIIGEIVLLIIIGEIGLLYREFKELREKVETYPEKTNGFITQLCDLIDHNSEMEEKILNGIAEKLEKRDKE